MSKAKLQAAREYIQANDYDQARSILDTLDHPTAEKWLGVLDRIAPRKRQKPRVWLRRVFVVMVVLAVLTAALVVYGDVQMQNYYRDQLPEAQAALSLFCTISTTLPAHRCEQWINETFEADLSRVTKVITCERVFDSITAPRDFAGCLASRGIYLP